MKLIIEGSEWTYSLVHNLKAEDRKQGLWGSANRQKRTLQLSDSLPNEVEARKTFIHELTHVMLDCVDEKMADDEAFVDKLGSVLYDTLERNHFLNLPQFLGVKLNA